jgi:hypothetical protein
LETVASRTSFHLLHIPLLYLFVVKMSAVDELYRHAEEVLAKQEEFLLRRYAQCYKTWVILKIFREWFDLTDSRIRKQFFYKLGQLVGHCLIFLYAFMEANDQRKWLNENREEQMPLWPLPGWTPYY